METNALPKHDASDNPTGCRPRFDARGMGFFIVACFVAAPACTTAQELAGRFELTPYEAYRFGGEFEERGGDRDFALDERAAQGVIFGFPAAAENGRWEALYAHQPTFVDTAAGADGGPQLEIDIDYLHFGGAYRFDGNAVRPFVMATVGAAHFSPRLPGFGSETFLSGSLGGGVQLRADKPIGVRLEGRLFATFLGHDTDIFCDSSRATGGCAIAIASSPLLQWEIGAGIVFRF
jgi:hypothetical protein